MSLSAYAPTPAVSTRRPDKYNALARTLHWLSAGVIVWATITGFYASTLPAEAALRASLAAFNVALTTLFIPVFMLRVINRIVTIDPQPLHKEPRLNRISLLAQLALYGVVAAVLLTGVLAVDHRASIFGLFDLDPIPLSEAQRRLANLVHRYGCMLLAAALVAHIAAVIVFMRKGKPMFARMWG